MVGLWKVTQELGALLSLALSACACFSLPLKGSQQRMDNRQLLTSPSTAKHTLSSKHQRE